MFKLKWKIAIVIFLVASLSTSIIGLSSWNTYKESLTLESMNALDYYVKAQWTEINQEILDVTDGRMIINNYVEDTFDLQKAQIDSQYMDGYMDELKLVVQTIAQHQSNHSAYVYFDPQLFGAVYGTWYADIDHDGIVEEQPQIALAYFDATLANREWFYKPLKERITSWTSPYLGQLSHTSEVQFISLTGPAVVKDKIVAVTGVDYFLEILYEQMKNVDRGDMHYTFLLEAEYRIMYHPDYPVGTLFLDLPDQHGKDVIAAFTASDDGRFSYHIDNKEDSILSYRKLDNGWIYGCVMKKEHILHGLYNTQKMIVLLIGIALIVSILLSLYFGRIISKPLEQMARIIKQIGEGFYETRIDQRLIMNNNELGVLALAVDKMREQILVDFESADETQQILEDMNKELLLRNERLQALSEAKGQFLANMSHEIRTPLNGIMGSLQLLEMNQSEAQKELIHISKSSTEALMDVLNGILDYSKIETNLVEFENKPFNVMEVVTQSTELFKHSAQIKGIQLLEDIDSTVPKFAIGDAFRLKQILSNLIGNAIKYTNQGSIQVAVKLTESHSSEELRLNFSVQDTGIGVPANKLDILFNSFSQVDSSDTRRYGGTGLGLSICKGLVEKMGGSITVESEVGTGSTFSFTCVLKCYECDQIEGEELQRQDTITGSKKQREVKILLAEDDAVSAMIMKKYAEAMHWDLLIVNNGVEAITRMNSDFFDIVFMDIQMPIMDGLEASKQIRNVLGEKTIPIIATTAHSDLKNSNDYVDAGMNDFLIKPVKMSDFNDMINKWVLEKG